MLRITEQEVAALCGIPYTTLRQWRYKVKRKNYWNTHEASPFYHYAPRLVEGKHYVKGPYRQKLYTPEGLREAKRLAFRYKQRKGK